MARKIILVLVVLLLSLSAVVIQPTFSSISTPDSWMTKAPMRQARGGLGVVSVNDTIYAIGGSTASGLYPSDQFGGLVGTNEAYNTTTNSWTHKSPMPTPRDYFAIAAYQNKIYCIGGHIKSIIDDSTHHSQFVVSGVTEVYNAETDKWETKTPMPTIGMYLQASVTNGKILVTGAGNYLYDPKSDSWSDSTDLPFVSYYQPNGGDKFLAVQINNKTVISDIRQGAAVQTLGTNAPIGVYVMGLEGNSFVNQVYTPSNNSWSRVAIMPTNRIDFGLSTVSDKIYAIGGFRIIDNNGNVAPTDANEQYLPIGYGTLDPSMTIVSSPTPTVPEFSLWSILLPLSLIATAAGLLVYHKKHKGSSVKNS